MKRSSSKTRGFTAMELVVGVSLTLLLALGVGPLIVHMQSSGVREGDRSVAVLQGRVAAARLERDLRTATSEGCPFQTAGPILQAEPRQLTFIGRRSDADTLIIVEWELVGSTLMRRWGECPAQKPVSFLHAIYLDNKTMLQGVGVGATFSYVLDDGYSMNVVAERDLCRVAAVSLSCGGVDRDGAWWTLAEVKARVGR